MGDATRLLLERHFDAELRGPPALRALVAASPLLYERHAHLLAKDRSVIVRRHLAANPAVPVDLLRALAAGRDDRTRAAAFRNPKLPGVELLDLARTPEERALAASHPDCPASMLVEQLASLSGRQRLRVLIHPNLPDEHVIATLAELPDECCAFRPLTPATRAAVLELVAAGGATARWCANPSWSAGDLHRIVLCAGSNRSRHVMWHLAANPSCPPEFLDRIEHRHGSSGEFAARLADNPSTPSHVLARMIDSGRPWGDRVVRHPACPPHVVRSALDGEKLEHTHLIGAAQTAHVTPGDVQRLLTSGSFALERAIVGNDLMSDECLAVAHRVRPDQARWELRQNAGPSLAAAVPANRVLPIPFARIVGRLGVSAAVAEVAWALRAGFDGTVTDLVAVSRALI